MTTKRWPLLLAVGLALALPMTAATAHHREGHTKGGSEDPPPPSDPADIRFADVTESSGIGGRMAESYSHAAAWGDVDGDGGVDLYVGTFAVHERPAANTLFLRRGAGFVRSEQPSIETESRTSGAVLVDLDGDGDLDLVEANNTGEDSSNPVQSAPSRILRNLGDGTFQDASDGSGIEAVNRRARSVGVLDYDGDGDQDLLVVADALISPYGTTKLLRNDGDLTFTEVTADAGLPTNFSGLGVAVGDANADGWPDVVVTGGVRGETWATSDFAEARLFVNDGGTFRDASPPGLGWVQRNIEDWTAGAAWGDLDRDGRLDLVVSHHFDSASSDPIAPRVFLNRGNDANGDPVLEELVGALPPIASKAPHIEVQDMDNDGWMDIYTSVLLDTPNGAQPLVFRNLGGGTPTFSQPDTSEASQIPYYAPGGPTADWDRDGHLDLFFEGFDRYETPTLWRNVTQTTNASVRVAVSVPGNVAGLGARVHVYDAGQLGNGPQLVGLVEISTGNGYSSAQEPVAHIGVGSRAMVDVEVVLPHDGGVLQRCGVSAGSQVTLTTDDLVTDGGTSPPGRGNGKGGSKSSC